MNPDDSQPRSSYRQREDFSSGDSSGLDQDVAILFIGLTVDVVDGVVLGLVRSKEGDLETNYQPMPILSFLIKSSLKNYPNELFVLRSLTA